MKNPSDSHAAGICQSVRHDGEVLLRDARARLDSEFFCPCQIELKLSKLASADEAVFRQMVARVDASPLKAETYNCFFPSSIALVGEAQDISVISDYTRRALERAARLGGKIAVIGSGKARNIPDTFSREAAEAQFVSVLRLCGDIAAGYGMTVAIEPLNARETNLVNTVAEGIALCRRVAHPHVACLADFFHVSKSGESLAAIEQSDGALVHVHIAGSGRTFAELPACRETVAAWVRALAACHYGGRVSLEGTYAEDFCGDIKRTRCFLGEMFGEV